MNYALFVPCIHSFQLDDILVNSLGIHIFILHIYHRFIIIIFFISVIDFAYYDDMNTFFGRTNKMPVSQTLAICETDTSANHDLQGMLQPTIALPQLNISIREEQQDIAFGTECYPFLIRLLVSDDAVNSFQLSQF